MNWRVVLSIILVAAAIVIGGALWRQHGPGSTQLEAGRSDYTLYDFELVSLDAEGREAFTLHAPKLTRDPAVRTLDIATPVFAIPVRAGGNGAPWDVHSKTGWVSAAGDEIRLRGDVVATSTDADGQPIRMDTQQLNVFPQSNRATSAVQVAVRQPGLILNGHGMDAKLDSRVVLLQNVKARYEKSP
jgi:lipopolysaccharide export system protein LptC